MRYSISYQLRAMEEFDAATQWYRERSEVAAENFVLAVREKIDVLRLTPTQYKKTYKQFYTVALNKYPYSLIYLIDQERQQVIISSIYHHKRNPRNKYRK